MSATTIRPVERGDRHRSRKSAGQSATKLMVSLHLRRSERSPKPGMNGFAGMGASMPRAGNAITMALRRRRLGPVPTLRRSTGAVLAGCGLGSLGRWRAGCAVSMSFEVREMGIGLHRTVESTNPTARARQPPACQHLLPIGERAQIWSLRPPRG